MIRAFDVAFDVPETRPLWKTRLLFVGLAFLIGTYAALAFAFMIIGPTLGKFLAEYLGRGKEVALAWPVLRHMPAIAS